MDPKAEPWVPPTNSMLTLPALPLRQASTSAVAVPVNISPTSEYLENLKLLVHSPDTLKGGGYTLDNLTPEEIDAKRRCKVCGKFVHRHKRPEERNSRPLIDLNNEALATPPQIFGEFGINKESTDSSSAQTLATASNTSEHSQPSIARKTCWFHPGFADRQLQLWTCCNKTLSQPPCCGEPEHRPVNYRVGQLEQHWRYYETPIPRARNAPFHPAVAIDCEMGTAKNGDSELIRVTLLDYFSGEALVDRLVYPDVEMQHYNTRYSGVTRHMMEVAKRKGTCIFGKSKARELVWKFIRPETIVVGHSAHNDLNSLRWIHRQVIDSFMLEPKPVAEDAKKMERGQHDSSEANHSRNTTEISNSKSETVPTPQTEELDAQSKLPVDKKEAVAKVKQQKVAGPRALKTLARVKLGREIQNNGRQGHDSFEDALASRDLVHWAIVNRGKSLKT